MIMMADPLLTFMALYLQTKTDQDVSWVAQLFKRPHYFTP